MHNVTPAYRGCGCPKSRIHPVFIDYCGICGAYSLEAPSAVVAPRSHRGQIQFEAHIMEYSSYVPECSSTTLSSD